MYLAHCCIIQMQVPSNYLLASTKLPQAMFHKYIYACSHQHNNEQAAITCKSVRVSAE